MKKKAICLLMVGAMALMGCEAEEPTDERNQNDPFEQVSSATEEVVDEAVDSVIDYTAFVGEYEDSYTQRASMSVVENETHDGVIMVVSWADSAESYIRWTMNAVFDDTENQLYYLDEKSESIGSDDSDNPGIELIYENEMGYFEWNPEDGSLSWTGAHTEYCRYCVFEKMDYVYGQSSYSDSGEYASLQEEMDAIEALSMEFENGDCGDTQMEMNEYSYEWFMLWDDELNSLWSRLSEEVDAETKAILLEEQREWIKAKENEVTYAGLDCYGGSMAPLVENSVAEELTRTRAYVLAQYLADARGEDLVLSDEIMDEMGYELVDLDDTFASFEGQHMFDFDRGACVGVEKTENTSFDVSGSHWIVWVTGGDIISDLDVYCYSDEEIYFKSSDTAYYYLHRNSEYNVEFAYANSLEDLLWGEGDVIVCE